MTKSKLARHSNNVDYRDLVAQAYQLRLSGMTTTEVAARLGVSAPTVSRYLNREIARLNAATADQLEHLRVIEDQRLEACWRALWPKITRGDIAAITVAIRLSERKSRLWGLDAEIDVRVTEAVNSELNDLLTALRAALPANVFEQIVRVASSIKGSVPLSIDRNLS